MSIIRLVNYWNSKICLVGGGFLNILMMFIICTKTPAEMQIYSKILLQTCVLDLCNLVMDELVQPLLFTQNGTAHVVFSGIAGHLPYPWNAIIYLVWVFFASFVIVGLLLQFLFRYLVLCKGLRMTTAHYFLMLLTAVCIHAGLISTQWLISAPAWNAIERDPLILRTLGLNESILEGIDNGRVEAPPEIRLTVDGRRGNVLWLLFHLAFDGVNFGAYAVMVYTGKKMIQFVNCQVKSGKLAELSRQLTKNLIIQAGIPVIALIGWTYCFYTCVVGDVLPREWNNLLTGVGFNPPQVWISVLNPVVTFMTVKPYKKALVQILKFNRGDSVGISSHHNSSNNNNNGHRVAPMSDNEGTQTIVA